MVHELSLGYGMWLWKTAKARQYSEPWSWPEFVFASVVRLRLPILFGAIPASSPAVQV